MIKSNDGNVELHGQIEKILFEAAHIMHTVAMATTKEIDEVEYDNVIKKIISNLATIISLDKDNPSRNGNKDKDNGFDKREIEFLREATALQNKHKGNPTFIFVDEMRHDVYISKNNNKQVKKGFTVKDFIMDPRHGSNDFDE